MEFGSVGVIAIGRNEGVRLLTCLDSVLSETGTMVYVDSGSSDGSVEAAARAGAATVVLEPGIPFSAARARNEGFKALRALAPDVAFVQFIDGDCALATGWLRAALATMLRDPSIAVVCGRRRERHPEASIFNRLIDIEWDTPLGEAESCGGDSLMRAAAFEEAGGFSAPIVAGEEPELCARLRQKGWKILRIGDEMTLHDASVTRLSQWWRRGVRSGYGYALVLHLYPQSSPKTFKDNIVRSIVWGGIIPAVVVIGAFVNPWLLLALLIYPLQVARIALRRGRASTTSWAYGLLATASKFAEMQGVLKYAVERLLGVSPRLVEYK